MKENNKPKLSIGSRNFATKREAKAFYSGILQSTCPGDRLGDDDHQAILDLIGRHPSLGSIIQEVSCIEVEKLKLSFMPGGRRFVAILRNGKRRAFSYIVALDGQKSALDGFRAASRRIVMEDLHAWKMKQMQRDGTFVCAVSGKSFPMDAIHVDHKPPLTFSVIVKGFLAARKIDPQKVCIREIDDIKMGFEDDELASDFREYHRQMAVLRIIQKRLNVEKASKGRIRPSARDGTLLDFVGDA